MLRKLNFTERVKIPRAAVTIRLRRESDGVLSFVPALSLYDLPLPPRARVYIEAHYRSSYMRFDCGTVEKIVIPTERRLDEIDTNHAVRFRIKVVDNEGNQHRIVGVVDDILVREREPGDGSRQPLLEAEFRDLGDLVWRIHYDQELPVLELNNRLAGIEQLAKNDPLFLALVYPAAVREILTTILLIDRFPIDEESDEWWTLWMRWAMQFADELPGEDPDERRQWIDEVVATFAAQQKAVSRLAQADRKDR